MDQLFSINFLLSDREKKHFDDAARYERLSIESEMIREKLVKKLELNNIKDKYLIKQTKLILSKPDYIESLINEEEKGKKNTIKETVRNNTEDKNTKVATEKLVEYIQEKVQVPLEESSVNLNLGRSFNYLNKNQKAKVEIERIEIQKENDKYIKTKRDNIKEEKKKKKLKKKVNSEK